MAPHIAVLAVLEGHRGEPAVQQLLLQCSLLQIQAGQPQSQADDVDVAQLSKQCLLAVGDHIEAAQWASWLGPGLDPPILWGYIMLATHHRLDGTQLAKLYGGVKAQRQRQRAQGACH